MTFIRDGKVITLQEARAIADTILREELTDLGRHVIKNYLQPLSPEDEKTYKNSHRLRFTGYGFDVKMFWYSNDPKAKHIEEGRPPLSTNPPFKAIYAWVRRKGLTDLRESTRRSRTVSQRVLRQKKVRTYSIEKIQIMITKRIIRDIALYGIPGKFLYSHLEDVNQVLIQNTRNFIKIRLTNAFNS